MPDRWFGLDLGSAGVPFHDVLARLAVAALLGGIIAFVGRRTARRPAAASFPLVVTLVLLPVLVAMTTLVIADNVARAFGLVGALSIVRFRTVVEDTRDTVFIVFSVVTGMAIGAGDAYVCAAGVPIVSLLALGLDAWGRRPRESAVAMTLEVRLGLGVDPATAIGPRLDALARTARLVGIATARQGAATDYRYEILASAAEAQRLAGELSALDGVQSVNFRAT